MKSPLALAAFTLSVTAGCYSSSRGHVLEDRVDKLTAENQRLAAELKDTQQKLAATLPQIDSKISETSKALEGMDRASRRSDADVGVQLQKNVEDVAELRGQVDQYLHKIEEMESVLRKYGQDTEQGLAALQGSDAAKAAVARRKAEELKKPTDKRSFLALADQKAREGDLALARQLYGEFLNKWGRDDLASQAHYGMGETYYQEDKCREALFEYGKVIKEYPKSRSAPSSYLHSADCFKKLKMVSEAKLALEEVIRGFPGTQAARDARVRLAQLNKSQRSSSSKKERR
jgi:tol-pal system protein YbgF